MALPSAEEINPIPEDLDGKCAEDHFCGMTLDQAEALFVDNGIYYGGDLMWMGPVGFIFYFQAALAYLKSDESQGDADFVHTVIGTLVSRLTDKYNDYERIIDGADLYTEFCQHILENYESYDLDPDFYGDLRPDVQRILARILS